MGLSIWHILIVLLVVLIVFGAGRLPHVMGDLGKGIRSFKDGLGGDSPCCKHDADKPSLPPADKNADKNDTTSS
ncbi:MAG: twin-arginine translocase TatA/TatE family subunit [Alphaproteobacteria bacterium]|nr:twin-arginine translocase TatA/TatE family subunit [Alphaproteobacteria bacterium]